MKRRAFAAIPGPRRGTRSSPPPRNPRGRAGPAPASRWRRRRRQSLARSVRRPGFRHRSRFRRPRRWRSAPPPLRRATSRPGSRRRGRCPPAPSRRRGPRRGPRPPVGSRPSRGCWAPTRSRSRRGRCRAPRCQRPRPVHRHAPCPRTARGPAPPTVRRHRLRFALPGRRIRDASAHRPPKRARPRSSFHPDRARSPPTVTSGPCVPSHAYGHRRTR
jgi:hypothetical protein